MSKAATHVPPRGDPPLVDRVGFLISQLGSHAAGRFARRLQPLGLQPRHWGLLSHLAAADGQTQQALADALGIHRNGMVGLVDDLEDRGLVQRHRHPADRRAHAVYLTDTAHELLAQARQVANEHDTELLAGLDEPDQRTLIELLQRMAHHIGLVAGVHPSLHAADPANPRTYP